MWKTNDPDVPATVFVRKGRTMVALASWAGEQRRVKLSWDWKALGLNPRAVHIMAPEIETLQNAAEFTAEGEITVEPGKGIVLIAE